MPRKAEKIDPEHLEELRRDVAVDPMLPEPLHAQISRGLRRWLGRRSPGDRMPPERLVAELIGVDRITFRRALRDFVRDGILARRVRGTFIMRVPDDPAHARDGGAEAAHPFALMSPGSIPAKFPLKVVLYENLPQQRSAWEKAVSLFNRRKPGSRLEISWLPSSVATEKGYSEYVRSERPDLVQVDASMAARMSADGLLERLPPGLAAQITGGGFHRPAGIMDGLYPFAVPVHLSMWAFLWNRKLAGDAGPELPPSADVETAVDAMLRFQPRGGTALLSAPQNLLLAAGIPQMPAKGGLGPYFRRILRPFAKFAAAAGDVLAPEAFPFSSVIDFAEGRTVFFAGNITHLLLHSPAGVSRNWTGVPLMPLRGNLLPINCSMMAAAKGGNSRSAEFLSFLAEQAAQSHFPESGVNFCFRKDANGAMMRTLGASCPEAAAGSLKLHVVDPSVNKEWVPFIEDAVWHAAVEIAEGRTTLEAAAALLANSARSSGLCRRCARPSNAKN